MSVESVRLPVRRPFAADSMLAFLQDRCVPGVELVHGRTYARTVRLRGGTGTVELTLPDDADPGHDGTSEIGAVFRLDADSDLAEALDQCRRLLDLGAD
ncbi:MAG: AlkA N-terminal domain-containing protein, partial [Nakamurella sp.]